MARPDYPKPYTPLSPECISRIRGDQAEYDKDPVAWERRERIQNEERDQERQREQQMEREEYFGCQH